MSLRKSRRFFSEEFKLDAVKRFIAGEGATALAHELGILRKQLYEWKDTYLIRGEGAFQNRSDILVSGARSERRELLLARQRIAELERKVGKQEMEIDFFVEALRRVKDPQKEVDGNNVRRCTSSSKSRHRKAD